LFRVSTVRGQTHETDLLLLRFWTARQSLSQSATLFGNASI
jgi:hypothetical protein